SGSEFSGKVVNVADGDTIIVLDRKIERRVSLVGIDVPEKGQPYSDRAKRELSPCLRQDRPRDLEDPGQVRADSWGRLHRGHVGQPRSDRARHGVGLPAVNDQGTEKEPKRQPGMQDWASGR